MERVMLNRWFVVIALVLLAACQPKTDAPKSESPVTAAQSAAQEMPKNQTNSAPAVTAAQTAGAAVEKKEVNPALLNPAAATEKAPESFKVNFDTTKGKFVVEVTRAWSPNGADRFYNLVKLGFYDDVAFFRVLDGFVAQFGIHGDPSVMKAWRDAHISDDPVTQSNKRASVVFATGGPNTRTTQLFINFGNNTNLDAMGFSPFGTVTEGMEVVDALYKDYGEGAPRGMGPDQGSLQERGNAYLKESFPKLDYVKTATIAE